MDSESTFCPQIFTLTIFLLLLLVLQMQPKHWEASECSSPWLQECSSMHTVTMAVYHPSTTGKSLGRLSKLFSFSDCMLNGTPIFIPLCFILKRKWLAYLQEVLNLGNKGKIWAFWIQRTWFLLHLHQFKIGSSSIEGDVAVPLESMKLPWCIRHSMWHENQVQRFWCFADKKCKRNF